MNEINLNFLELKTFTEQDASDYCLLNDINRHVITELDLSGNELTDISGIKVFKNLEYLDISNSKIKDITVLKHLKNLEILILFHCININNISPVKNLKNLEILDINNLKLESDQIQYIKSLNNLETLYCYKGFKDMRILKQLNKNIKLYK